MNIQEEISKAISAHGQWKVKLRKAIDTGECESTPAKVKMDNNCSFGKWLHNRIDDAYKEHPMYPEVVKLHAEFHKEAGAILELAMNGKTEEANARLGLGSQFSSHSAKLTQKMKEWQASVH